MENLLVISLGGAVMLSTVLSFLGANKGIAEVAAMSVAMLTTISCIALMASTSKLDCILVLVVFFGACASGLIQCRKKENQLTTSQLLAAATFLMVITLFSKTF